MADPTSPPPPSPPPVVRSSATLIALGSVVAVLLLILVVVLLAEPSDESGADPGPIATGASSVTTGSTTAPTTSPATLGFTLQPDDILISATSGVRIVRGTEVVGRAVTEPTEYALATPDGRVVHQAPAEFIYPDFWPGNEPIGEPKIWLTAPDGTTSLLYVGGASIRMFDVSVVPAVSTGPSIVALRGDALADGSRLNSLLVIPIDGSEPLVVSGVPVSVTGAAWLGEFFALAVNEEAGESYVVAVDLGGGEVAWPLNPEPLVGRDPSTRVTTLTRVGDTPLIAYTLASGGFWDGSIDLVVYDTSSGQTVTTLGVGFPQMIVSALHASDEALVVSKIHDLRDGSGWSFVHVPLTLYSTATWELSSPSIPGAGTYSVVGGTAAPETQDEANARPPTPVLPDSDLIYNQPVDDAVALLTAAGLTVEIAGIGCSNSTQPNMVRRVTVGSDQDVGIIYGKASDAFDPGAASTLVFSAVVTVWTPTSNPCP